jgi:hypothetical protein
MCVTFKEAVDAVTAVSALALVIVTGVYVIATWKMLREMQHQRKRSP